MAGDGISRNNGAKTGRGNPPAEHQFKPGNPGRPKGSRNKLGEAFIADLYADWLENGAATIEQVRTERPQDYLKVVASILPRDLNVRVNDLEDVSDDELIARIRELDHHVRPFLDGDEPSGTVN